MLENLLGWLTSTDGGAFALVLWGASWGLEELPQWQKLNPKAKSLAILGIASVVAVGAAVLQAYPDVVAWLDPFLTPVYYVVLAWLATQTVHKLNVGRKAQKQNDVFNG